MYNETRSTGVIDMQCAEFGIYTHHVLQGTTAEHLKH